MFGLRWHHVPVLAAALAALGFLVADALSVRPAYAVDWISGYLWMSQAAVACGVVWFAWVSPMIEPLHVPVRDSPRRRLKVRRWQIWLPTMVIGAWMLFAAGDAVRRLARGGAGADTPFAALLLLGVLVASVPVSAAVSRWFAERYRGFIRLERHCFECGYNLRGNPGAPHCPECGQLDPLADVI